MSNKYRIKYEKERVLLSDILPYEVPLFFSNKRFYDFVKKYNTDKTFKKKVPAFLEKHLFGDKRYTIPFNFEIRHKEDKPRTLSIIHPNNQVDVAELYNKYKSLIIYYGSKSKFSLRKIHSVSKEEYYDDDIHRKRFSDKDTVEVSNKEYKSLSSFFTYENYSIMYKFFESHDFHREEKRFAKMVKTDISQCFDSVYTHSFSWAVLDKSFVKENLRDLNGTFVDDFDELMQRMNYNETNGIVIGPEFSRIFSEIILQKIDINIQNELSVIYDLDNHRDYSIHRYIDDYFIFYNTDIQLVKIKKVLTNKLEEYNFFINDLKTEYFTKPLITNETIAKNQLKKLFEENVLVSKEDNLVFTFKANPQSIKTEIKSIARRNSLKYDNLFNYVFHLLSKKTGEASKLYSKNIKEIPAEKKKVFINDVSNFYWNILDIVFFLYSASPKVTQTISISTIIADILTITKSSTDDFGGCSDFIHKKIYDEIYSSIKTNANKDWSNLESIYLMTILRELGGDYSLSANFIRENLMNDKKTKNYFEIISILFYLYDKPEHKEIVDELLEVAKLKINSLKKNKENDTEVFLLLVDILTNSKIDIAKKKELISLFDNSLNDKNQKDLISFLIKENFGFTDWTGFNFRNSIKQKKRLRVY